MFFVTAEDGGVTAGPGLRLGHTLDRVPSTSRRANSLKRTSLEGVGGVGGEFLLLHILSVSYHSAPTVEGPGSKHAGVSFHQDLNLVKDVDSLDLCR